MEFVFQKKMDNYKKLIHQYSTNKDSFSLNRNQRLMKYLFLIIFSILVTKLEAVQITDIYSMWKDLSPTSLFEKGKHFLDKGAADSALVCFTIITEKMDKTDNSENSKLAARAYMGKWTVLFYHYFDYGKSLDCLQKAESFAAGDKEINMLINMRYGTTYHTISAQCADTAYMRKAYKYYVEAMKTAIIHNKENILDIIMSNIIELEITNDNNVELQPLWKKYSAHKKNNKDTLYIYNKLMFDGFMFAQRGLYQQAVGCFDKQIELLGKYNGMMRYYLMSYINKAKMLAQNTQPIEAIACLKVVENTSEKQKIKDIQMEVYKLLSKYYGQAGQKDKSIAYHVKYLEIKEELLTLQQLKILSEQIYVSKLENAAEQTRQIRQKQKEMSYILYCMAVVSFVVVVVSVILHRKNKQLREKNIALYKRMEFVLEEKREKDMTKYKNSGLDETSKLEIKRKISEVVDNTAEIFSSDFTINRLAELTGEQVKHVSQIINETYKCNYNAFINKYRIQEACRRMKDSQNYGHLTIEGIAHSVGFKARSSFFNAFKTNTGLTPSEFIEIANKAKNQ